MLHGRAKNAIVPLVLELVENRAGSFSSSRSADLSAVVPPYGTKEEPLELKIVPWSELKPHIDVFEGTGKARTGLFTLNNPVNLVDPSGLFGALGFAGVILGVAGTALLLGTPAKGLGLGLLLAGGALTAYEVYHTPQQISDIQQNIQQGPIGQNVQQQQELMNNMWDAGCPTNAPPNPSQ